MSQDTDRTETLTNDRESWLNRAVEVFRPRFTEIGFPLPEKLRIAVGFGPTGARKESAKILGVTLASVCTKDMVNEIWISPEDADTASMLATVIHELAHAATDCNFGILDKKGNWVGGHGGDFPEIVTRLGLTGPMTATSAGQELAWELLIIAASLGEYPGSQVDLAGIVDRMPEGVPVPAGGGGISSGPKKQGTRQLKLVCDDAGCRAYGRPVRTTRSYLEEFGTPYCAVCRKRMTED